MQVSAGHPHERGDRSLFRGKVPPRYQFPGSRRGAGEEPITGTRSRSRVEETRENSRIFHLAIASVKTRISPDSRRRCFSARRIVDRWRKRKEIETRSSSFLSPPGVNFPKVKSVIERFDIYVILTFLKIAFRGDLTAKLIILSRDRDDSSLKIRRKKYLSALFFPSER